MSRFEISLRDGLAGALFTLIVNFALMLASLQILYLSVFSIVNMHHFAKVGISITRQELVAGFAAVFVLVDLILLPILFEGAASFLTFRVKGIVAVCLLWAGWEALTVYTIIKSPAQWYLYTGEVLQFAILVAFLIQLRKVHRDG